MKSKKKKTTVFVQELYPEGNQNKYSRIIWILFLTALLSMGILNGIKATWGSLVPSKWAVFLITAVGFICCLLSEILKKHVRYSWLFMIIPWPFLLVPAGMLGGWNGAKSWINVLIGRWNMLHNGGTALFSVNSGNEERLIFTLVLTLLVVELTWIMIRGHHIVMANIWALLWIIIQLLCAVAEPVTIGLFFAALGGLWLSDRNLQVTRSEIIWTIAILVIVCLPGSLVSVQELEGVSEFRENVETKIHEVRYGKDTLPEGNLYRAAELQQDSREMLQLETQQQKNLYLKGYVGVQYTDGFWDPMPDSVYGGEQAGMLEWLKKKGFDPLTQVSSYYAYSESEDKPERNRLDIAVSGASRYYVYTPASLQMIRNGSFSEKKDSRLSSRGLLGASEYAFDELSGSRPAELMVTESWVSDPQTDKQKKYLEAEKVYRSFVYENYRSVDSDTASLIREMFWKEYESDSDGIYSAICQVRKVLKETAEYTEDPEEIPDGEDPVKYFLTESRNGNSMLYASVAVDALRVHGIPARYVEGYYISGSQIEKNNGKAVSVTGQNAHAWVEAYFDGIGWLPLDVSPGYYYDAVALQKMVSSPDVVQKNATLKDNSFGAEQVSGLDENRTHSMKEKVLPVVYNVAAICLGVAAVLLMLLVLVIVFMEIVRGSCLWLDKKKMRKGRQKDRIFRTERKIYSYLKILGIDARLGWNTMEIDRQLVERFEDMEEGEYKRVCALIEKIMYGDIELEPYEERTINSFLEKLLNDKKAVTWKNWFRRRYVYVWKNRK